MLFLLDTNIILFYAFNPAMLDSAIMRTLNSPESEFIISTVSIVEIIHLHKNGRLKYWENLTEIVPNIMEGTYKVLTVKTEHLNVYAKLEAQKGHNDPNDHLIIAQAMSENIYVISSDHKFKLYEPQGLKLKFNKKPTNR
jgi:PIN domain nuclease of toxin-antitoxin system